MRYVAGIDIGTNTLLMLIVRRDSDGTLHVIRDEHRIARLGQGVNASGIISVEAIKRASLILKEYADILTDYPGIDIRAVSTSAMRDATNKSVVTKELESVLQYPIECISGEEEAKLTFLGTVESHDSPIVLDIGGGSTEVIMGTVHDQQCTSMDIGAVRIKEMFMKSFPMNQKEIEDACAFIDRIILQLPKVEHHSIIATAGTPTTLAAMDLGIHDLSSEMIHCHYLSIETVERFVNILLRSRIEDILNMPGVHPQRADILPAGTLILHRILKHMNALGCIVSKRGLRFGVAYSILNSITSIE